MDLKTEQCRAIVAEQLDRLAKETCKRLEAEAAVLLGQGYRPDQLTVFKDVNTGRTWVGPKSAEPASVGA